MVATAVVRLSHAHTVVREVHIAVVAEELRHSRELIARSTQVTDVLRRYAGSLCSALRSFEVEMFGELEKLRTSAVHRTGRLARQLEGNKCTHVNAIILICNCTSWLMQGEAIPRLILYPSPTVKPPY